MKGFSEKADFGPILIRKGWSNLEILDESQTRGITIMSRINHVVIIGSNSLAKSLYKVSRRLGLDNILLNDLSNGINADIVIVTETLSSIVHRRSIQL